MTAHTQNDVRKEFLLLFFSLYKSLISYKITTHWYTWTFFYSYTEYFFQVANYCTNYKLQLSSLFSLIILFWHTKLDWDTFFFREKIDKERKIFSSSYVTHNRQLKFYFSRFYPWEDIVYHTNVFLIRFINLFFQHKKVLHDDARGKKGYTVNDKSLTQI